MEKRMMKEAIESLVESPAWALLDDRYKKMAREIERLSQDPHLVVEERSWQNWLAWLDGTLRAVPVHDELDLPSLYTVIQHGYLKAKFETSPEVQATAVDPPSLVPKTREDIEALFARP